MLIFELLAGFPPFFADNPLEIYERILQNKFVFPAHVDFVAKDLVKRLLAADLTKRLGNLKGGARDVKAHRWFEGVDWEAVERKEIRVSKDCLSGSHMFIGASPFHRRLSFLWRLVLPTHRILSATRIVPSRLYQAFCARSEPGSTESPLTCWNHLVPTCTVTYFPNSVSWLSALTVVRSVSPSLTDSSDRASLLSFPQSCSSLLF